jgi:putative SOS response-associated peptidase YedK
MCGRFALAQQLSGLAMLVENEVSTQLIEDFEPSWNIAPKHKIPTVTFDVKTQVKQLCLATWGLRPSWSSPSKIEPINAQIETASSKPMFRQSWNSRRCIIPFDGWFEWKSTPLGKQPFFIHVESKQPVFFAGLWDQWLDKEADTSIISTAILTTEATESLKDVHHRMPVLVGLNQLDAWLEFGEFKNHDSISYTFYPVSKKVNSVGNNGPDLVDRVTGLGDYW